jgi:hypothetical protein
MLLARRLHAVAAKHGDEGGCEGQRLLSQKQWDVGRLSLFLRGMRALLLAFLVFGSYKTDRVPDGRKLLRLLFDPRASLFPGL